MESDTASSVWHIEVGKRPFLIRLIRTIGALVIAVFTMGEPGFAPSTRVWHVVETATGRILITVKSDFGDDIDHNVALTEDLRTLSTVEFAARWGIVLES